MSLMCVRHPRTLQSAFFAQELLTITRLPDKEVLWDLTGNGQDKGMSSPSHRKETREQQGDLDRSGSRDDTGRPPRDETEGARAATPTADHDDDDEEVETIDIRTRDPHVDPMCAHVMTSPTRPTRGLVPPAKALEPGTRIGAYEIRKLVGCGGCSTVYLAGHSTTGARVAIKVLHPRLALAPRQVLRFIHEAQAVQRIRHPNIVEIHETGHLSDGCPYLVMELIPGPSLADVLLARGRFAPQEALALLEPICEALAHVHDAGIVHRDIKASNIMLMEEPGGPRIKLLDFGIAKLMHGGQDDALKTSIGRILGTPHSMAPEQILGREVDGRTDVYALGALLFRLLTGRHPYSSRDAQYLVQMHLSAPLPRPSAHAPVAPGVDEVVQRAMAKDPEHRYASPRSLLAELRRVMRPGAAAAEIGVPALALLVQGSVHDDGADTDLAQVDLMEALDCAIAFLRMHGFEIALQTSDLVLGVIPVSEKYQETRLVVLHAAKVLYHELARRPGADPRVHINLCVHSGSAILRATGLHIHQELGQVRGGAILDVGEWAPRSRLDGVCATREVMPARTPELDSRYIRVDGDAL
jgi:serine/threonine-protein kinase